MCFKLSICCLVALVLAQEAFTAQVQQSDEQLVGVLREKIKQALWKLQENVMQLVQQAIGHLASLDLSLEINRFLFELDGIIKIALNTIDDLRDHSQEFDVNVAKCINKSKHKIKKFGRVTPKELRGCATDTVKEAASIIKSAIKNFQKNIPKVKDISAEFSACGSGISAIGCYTKISDKISGAFTLFAANISKEVLQTASLVTNLKNDLTVCAFKKIKDAYPIAEDIVETVTTCIITKHY